MSDGDIFREVEEELRREQLKSLWDRFGGYVVGTAIAIVAIVGGSQWWAYWQAETAAEDGVQFTRAMELKAEGKAEEARKLLTRLQSEGTAGYADLARLALAADMARRGEKDEAVVGYDKLAHDSSVDLAFRHFARLQAAMLRFETATVDEIRERLAPLADAKNSWRFSAWELLGLAHFRADEMAEAERVLTKVLVAPDAPPNLKRRADQLLQLVAAARSRSQARDRQKSGGDKGSVKPDGKKAGTSETN